MLCEVAKKAINNFSSNNVIGEVFDTYIETQNHNSVPHREGVHATAVLK